MTVQLPICFNCVHYLGQSNDIYSCRAFPKGIPDDILFNKFDHTEKHPDQDNDIIFEEKTE